MRKMRKFIKKRVRFLKKLVRGENPLVVAMPQGHWDRQFSEGYWDFLLDTPKNTAAIVQYLTEQYKDRKITILDVGCGNGIIPKLLSETDLTFDYTGTDISAAALTQAKENYPAGEYINQGMEDDLSLSSTFDVIIFSEVLLYGNAKKTLAAHKKFFTPDNMIIISLYKNWRTRLIWWQVSKYFNFVNQLTLSEVQGSAWDIKMGYYKHE